MNMFIILITGLLISEQIQLRKSKHIDLSFTLGNDNLH